MSGQQPIPSDPRFQDLTGRVFGRLTVLYYVGKRHGMSDWFCQCSCGNTTVVRGNKLLSGATQSCRCLAREVTGNLRRGKPFMGVQFVPPSEDLTGQQFGHGVVISEAERDPSGNRRWNLRCVCGISYTAQHGALKFGSILSCGCNSDRTTLASAGNGHGFRAEYRSWTGIRDRCLKPSSKDYHNYGARGITVCQRWLDSFEAFLADVGPRPSSKHTIDRIDNNGNYEPSNCRWATAKEQTNNTRRTVRLTHDGLTLSVAEWSTRIGVKRHTIYARLKAGLTTSQALSTTINSGGRPKT